MMSNFLHILRNLEVGDRIVVPKSAWNMVQHHAIFVGYWDNQYWFIENKEGHGVRIVSAAVFFAGVERVTRTIKFVPRHNYSRNDLYAYALTKRGRAYDLWNYNCEHFANEVQHRVIKSAQSENGRGIAVLGIAALVIAGLASLGRK
jgi:hypothetical protein